MTESTISAIAIEMISLGDLLILLFAYFYFVFNRCKLQTFFSDWKQIEDQLGDIKGIDPSEMKRTCTIMYKWYYIYNIFFRLLPFCAVEIFDIGDNDNSTAVRDVDFIAGYYPYLVSNPFYVIWIKFTNTFVQFVFVVFCPLIDIVPAIVY